MRYDGSITIKTQLDNSQFDREIEYVENSMREIASKLSQADMGEDVGDVIKLEAEYEKLSRKLGTLITKQKELDRADLTNVENSIKKVGNATGNVINKIGKWALAIFSVRTAYGLVSNAMSTLSQYDTQLQTDIEYLRYSVAMALKPVIEYIVSLAYKLLGIFRALGLKMFETDVFSEATAENFKKANTNASKLKKTLSGFDEMNILNSSSTGGGGGISSGDSVLSSQNIDKATKDAMSKLDKFMNNYNSMKKAIEDPNQFNKAYGIWGTFVQGVTRLMLGLVQTLGGIWKIIQGLFTGNGELLIEGAELLWEGIKNIVISLCELIIGLVMGLIYEIVSGIVGLGKVIVEILVGLVTGIYKYAIKPIWDFFAWLGTQIKVLITTAITGLVQTLSGIGKTVKKYVIDPIVTHFENMWNSLKKGGIKGLINYFIECWEKAINWIGEKFFSMLNKIKIKVPDWLAGAGIGAFSVNIKYKPVSLPRLAKGTILNNPGQGVMVGGRAIAGEAGREAFLPLSDTQLLEELGSTIGKYITINANITNSMNGRVISRELKRINANDNFAMNK